MTSIRLVKENIAKPIQQIGSAADVYQVMRFIENEDREKFYVLHLDTKNQILAMELVAIGTLTACLVHPREVYKAAILNNSCAIVCVHNHPSGDTKPSQEDRLLTGRLIKAGEILGIEFLDHVIIGRGGFSRVITLEEEIKAKELQQLHKKGKRRKAPAARRQKKTRAA